MLIAGLAVALVVVIGAVLLLGGGDDDSGGGDETPVDETPSASGPFAFNGTINYDMPTPSPAVPNFQFSIDEDTEVVVTFAISPVWEDCGFWWRVNATDSDFFYFGDHHLNADSVEDTVELPVGNFELQVGVSFESIDGHSCSGTADYQVEVTPQ
jgi:hypothetical protein